MSFEVAPPLPRAHVVDLPQDGQQQRPAGQTDQLQASADCVHVLAVFHLGSFCTNLKGYPEEKHTHVYAILSNEHGTANNIHIYPQWVPLTNKLALTGLSFSDPLLTMTNLWVEWKPNH